MISACGRYVMVFNGEVYNFEALRQQLIPHGHRFRGHSDTEVMLAAITEWGLEAAVDKFIGMYAFAVWDCEQRILHLVRDRVGIKPLYYGWAGKTFLFGSELKALCTHPDFVAEIDRDALTLLLRYQYIPYPHSIYRGVSKVPPGCILTIARDGFPKEVTLKKYWSAKRVAEEGEASRFQAPAGEVIEHLDALLRDAVRMWMVADVPLGAFLSGGIDSSTVVAMMQAQSNRSVKTFTIGFYEADHNEAEYAKGVAAHLGTDHTELYVTPQEAMAVIPRLPSFYDEPFADPSQIPTYLISALARQHVTVSLSGDGGDELFGGYNHYVVGRFLSAQIRRIPQSFRSSFSRLLGRGYQQSTGPLLRIAKHVLPSVVRRGDMAAKFPKLAAALKAPDSSGVHLALVSHWQEPQMVVMSGTEPPTPFTDPALRPELKDRTVQMMFRDFVCYLPEDILTKLDRASMAVSLEARVPLLDHRVVEFAQKVPLSMKIRNGQGKWILRQVLHRYVPRELIERPKMGFAVPVGEWLRGPLREWAESLLSEERLKREGYFHPKPVRKLWEEHLIGRVNWQFQLWDILMFQAWYDYWGRRKSQS